MTELRPFFRRGPDAFTAPVERVETEIRMYATGEEAVVRSVVEYDEEGNVRTPYIPLAPTVFHWEGVDFQVPGTTSWRVEHDDAGQPSRAIFLGPGGAVSNTITIERDVFGRTMRVMQRVGEQIIAELRQYHDDAERSVTSQLEMHGMRVFTRRELVDERGLVVAEEMSGLDGTTRRSTFTYTLNDAGDWVELVVHAEGYDGPVSRTTRTITYRSSPPVT